MKAIAVTISSVLLLVACTVDGTDEPAVPGTGTADDGDADDDVDAPGDTGSESASTGSDSDDEDAPPDLGPCARFIECVMDTQPQAITAAIATYGDEGTCWSLPGVHETNCWTECIANTEALQDLHPNAAACWDCRTDDDCPGDTPFCDAALHTCADWECRDDTDCRADAPYCSAQHTCAADYFHCRGSVTCLHGPADDIQDPCDAQRWPSSPGKCPTVDAIGICVTVEGIVRTVYEGYEGNPRSLCEILGGTWTPL